MKTTAAATAACIRAEIRKTFPGLKFTCTSENFSMGNAVRVRYQDQPPEIHNAISSMLSKYQYGHFDGMDDSYHYSNSRDDIPQVKYLNITNEMSDAKREEIYSKLRKNWSGGEELPETYHDGMNLNFQGEWVSTWVRLGFTGARQI